MQINAPTWVVFVVVSCCVVTAVSAASCAVMAYKYRPVTFADISSKNRSIANVPLVQSKILGQVDISGSVDATIVDPDPVNVRITR